MEQKKQNILLLIFGIVPAILFLLMVPSCSESPVLDCFTGTGEIEKSERDLPYFHSILLKNNINLELIPSNRNKLILEAGVNLKPKIITEVNGDSVLIIKNDNSCNWVRSYDKPINVYLEYTYLKNFEYRSIGTVTNIDTLKVDSLQIDIYEGAGKINLAINTYQCKASLHYGTADIYLSGKSDISFYYQLGAGKLDAKNLESSFVYLRNWSSNNMFVWANTEMSVEINGLGNVYYKGTPEISASLPGEGKLIPLD